MSNKINTGCSVFQICRLTDGINSINAHLLKNPKDYSSHRGLLGKVNKRKALISYLKKHDNNEYMRAIKEAKLRQ